ncbi:MAG: TIGR03618 family F420-dependent PPOX class oxidoreductase [Ilumatobacteraceae bacterium]|jgi:PPOX class probable F420-dependent enzyme
MTPADLTPAMLEFLRERHLATLTTLRKDGSPHVVPVGFTYDEDKHVVRVITFAPSQKAKHADRGGRAVVSQVDGGRWLTLEGDVRLVTRTTDNDEVNEACVRYAQRYRQPKEREDRVAIVISVDRIMGRVSATNE